MKSTHFYRFFSISIVSIVYVSFFIGCQTQQIDEFKVSIHDSLEHYYVGENLERQRDFDGAAEAYLKSLDISPRPRAYYRLAMVTMAQGDYESGETYLRKAVKLSPSFVEAQQRIDMLQERKSSKDTDPSSPWGPRAGDEPASPASPQQTQPTTPIEANQEAASQPKAAQSPPVSLSTLEQQAVQAFQSKQWQQAFSLYNELVQRSPENALYQYRAGIAQQQLGQPAESVPLLEKSVELNPSFASAWNDLGIVYESLGRSSEAVEAYQKAITNGSESGAYYNLAVLMEKQGEYKQAISLYEQFIALEGSGEFKERAEAQMTKLRRYAY